MPDYRPSCPGVLNNANVEGHDKLRYMVYFGGAPKYRQTLAEVARNDYHGFRFD